LDRVTGFLLLLNLTLFEVVAPIMLDFDIAIQNECAIIDNYHRNQNDKTD